MTADATAAGVLDVEDPWEAVEACYERGWSDGLPVVPPTEALVDAMIAAGSWDADEVLLFEPSRSISVTAHKAAVNAVMAGCRPEYFPVVGGPQYRPGAVWSQGMASSRRAAVRMRRSSPAHASSTHRV